MLTLSSPIKNISRIGNTYQERLKRLGIKTVRDLLWHFPYRYEDLSKITPISEVKLNKTVCVKGKIIKIDNIKTWKRKMFITEAIVKDETAPLKVIWFNQPYLTQNLKPGVSAYLAGKIVSGKSGIYLNNPVYEKTDKKSGLTHTGRIIPVYPTTEGLSSRWLRYILKPLLLNFKNKISESLPEEIIKEHKLLPIEKALWQIHFPSTLKSAERARHRFAFEELLLVQLSVLREKLRLKKRKSPTIPMNAELLKEFTDSLPFTLTDSQRKSAWQILKNLEKPRPMSRLLEGDVGSGKTVVATMAALNTAKAGYQVAFMAPTEILAKQHFKEVHKLLDDFKLKIGLLTGKEDKVTAVKLKNEVLEISRKKILEKTKEGKIDILIGTHALIQEKVKFKNLGLVIVDEQHRFGVEQRAKLINQKGSKEQPLIPHLLSMTATPIPRTLALTIYGDLDLSLITELPKNRKKVKTLIIPPKKRKKAYSFVEKEVKKGRGVFVICPRIEGASDISGIDKENLQALNWSDVKAVKEEYKRLSEEIFPHLKIGMLHGKMKAKEKEKIMQGFKEGEIDILVSTSVVEVGIDVPRATVMMVEGADRFGLAQLHQFRGRVGRSSFQSYCFLFTESSSQKVKKRLKALVRSENGFELAEKDMEIRGPGELYGTRQWGMPDLAMANLKDIKLVEETREAAKEILEKDSELKNYPSLRDNLKDFEKRIHFE